MVGAARIMLHSLVREKLKSEAPEVLIRPDVSRVPCVEVCICNATIRKMIAEGRDGDLLSVVKSSYEEGMIDFNETLRRLVEEEYIDTATAYAAAPNAEELRMKLKGINISGSGILG